MQTESNYKKHLRPPPAYLEYPSDLLANMKFRRMSLPERGLWQTMRLECWVNKTLPKNPEEIALVLNLPLNEVQANLTSGVLGFFVENEEGFYCKELEEYRADQLHRQNGVHKIAPAIPMAPNESNAGRAPNTKKSVVIKINAATSDPPRS